MKDMKLSRRFFMKRGTHLDVPDSLIYTPPSERDDRIKAAISKAPEEDWSKNMTTWELFRLWLRLWTATRKGRRRIRDFKWWLEDVVFVLAAYITLPAILIWIATQLFIKFFQ